MKSTFFSLLIIALPIIPAVSAQEPTGKKFPPELVNFVPYRATPLFTGRAKGGWDAKIRERGWIIKEGDVYKMWYTGYTRAKDGICMLGYATSPDGITWTRHPENPIYKEHWVEDMMIVKHDGKYWMFAEGYKDRAHLLVSDDGLKWTRIGQLDIRKKNGDPIAEGPFGTPTAWFENGIWNLFYEREDKGIWLATSKDMKVWQNVQDEPVMVPGPKDFERDAIALNQIIKHKGRYYAYYHGATRTEGTETVWHICVATSTDLIHWEKYDRNPLLPLDQNKSSGILVPDGDRFRLYSMHPAVYLHVPAP